MYLTNQMNICPTDTSEAPPVGPRSAQIRAEFLSVLEEVGRCEKPWLQWASTWGAVEKSKQHQVLRRYLTDPVIQRERLGEVRLCASSLWSSIPLVPPR